MIIKRKETSASLSLSGYSLTTELAEMKAFVLLLSQIQRKMLRVGIGQRRKV